MKKFTQYLEAIQEDKDEEMTPEGEAYEKEAEEAEEKEEEEPKDIDWDKAIVEFFTGKKFVDDDDYIHPWAEKLGVHASVLESKIYEFIRSFLAEGESKGFKGTYDPVELALGVKVEMADHTTNVVIATKIAKDHLSTDPKYYTKGRDLKFFSELIKKEK